MSELVPTTPGAGTISDLLRDLRASEDLQKTPDGMRLMMRVEGALVNIDQNSGLGQSQITNFAAMKAYMDFGTFVAKATTLPDHLRDRPADCMAIAMRADRWGLDFFGVAEKTAIINGKLGFEAQLVSAILKKMNAITGSFRDEYFGDWTKVNGKFQTRESKTQKDKHGNPSTYKVQGWKPEDEEGLGIRIWATLTGETEPRYLEVRMTQALVRNSTMWTTNPQQQIFYLAEKLWARKYAPEALLGVFTTDELGEAHAPRDMGPADVVPPKVTPAKGLSEEELAAWRVQAQKGLAAAEAHWRNMGRELRSKSTQDQQADMRRIAEDADRKRTVDNGANAAPAATEAPAQPSAAAQSDPATGEIPDPTFVAAMDAAEAKAGAAK